MLCITNAIDSLLDIYIALSKHCHFNLLLYTGVVLLNEPPALKIQVRSLAA